MNKQIASPLVALGFMFAANTAFAQAVVIQPEQETVIKEYVTKHKVESVDAPDVTISVGESLPDTVELHELDVPDVSYRYVVVNGKTVLVDPGTRKIVRVMD